MVFTVVRYLPILEEETPSHRVEMVKKSLGDDATDGDDSNDSDDDNVKDEKTDLYCHQLTDYFPLTDDTPGFHFKHKTYRYLVANINTPPPKF